MFRPPTPSMFRQATLRTRSGYAITVLGVAGLTAVLVPLRSRLGLLDIGMLYLFLVMLVATGWGWGPGLTASLLANLALNFFFVPPLHRLSVAAPVDALTLLVFLAVAAVTSRLLARARTGELAARQRAQETEILFALSRATSGTADTPAALQAVCDRARATFGAVSCAVLQPGEVAPTVVTWSGPPDDGIHSADERAAAARALERGTPVTLGERLGYSGPRIVGARGRQGAVMYAPLRAGSFTNGWLRLVGRLGATIPTHDAARLLEAFADEAAAVLERRRLAEQAARVEILSEADRLKTALLATVSHDLRTPLASIKASVSSLLDPTVVWDSGTRVQFLEAIDEETDRLTRLVVGLLDLSRIEGGALHPARDWYDVAEFVHTVVARATRGSSAHQVAVHVAPDTDSALFDYVQIEQVLTNLIENAMRYAPPGSCISVAARRCGAHVAISVRDHGPGIPAAERERVFEKFYRGAAGQGVAGGAGLGLAICKGLVEANDGTIRAEDAPGGGALLVVTLPAPAAPPSRLALAEREG